MDIKTFLSQANWLDQLISTKVKQQGRVKDLALKVTTTYKDVQVYGGQQENSRMEASIVEMLALGKEINDDIDRLIEVKRDILSAIKTLDSLTDQLLLEMRYLDNRNWEEVAEVLCCDIRTVYRMHGRALRELENKGVTKCH
ncbi:DUF1492 domain-containing protein [Salisediminibacterium selenitireducens]|uniref:RNA polymerase, sigma 28 subunit, FliA/WhiG subfamily n=1 Tax=Bacillus selenitireducens (strain ATCC 700615 / DSM 15326 / MLS10) TaxID=439292 RepID=D6XZZ7_BACIE|nr:DUF1492 domain-containing protein [Salisediminibacterium selenitireducens]ADI00499.1 putative RNA polymerase, sigma 28 subunit, FliA/WhiG subfamily [[Bacillus] selenitireducens MLS10]